MSQLTRRKLLPLLLVPLAAAGPMIPTDIVEMNRFAYLYNEYVTRLGGDVIDTQLWSQVQRAWEKMTHA